MTEADFATLEPSGRAVSARSAPTSSPTRPRAGTGTATQRMQIDGRSVVLKRSTGRLRSRARAEADVLGRLAAAPVVELVARRETDESTDLVLVDAGDTDLAEQLESGDLDADALCGVLAAAARAVAELHELGWSHGAVCAEHVVVGQGGTVRLCSLGSARPSVSGGPEIAEDRRQLLALVAGCTTASERWVAAPRDRRRRNRGLRRLRRLVAEFGRSPTPPAAAQLADRLDATCAETRRTVLATVAGRRPGAARLGPTRPEVESATRLRTLRLPARRPLVERSSTRGRRLIAGTAAGLVAVGVAAWAVRPPPPDPTADASTVAPSDAASDIRPLATRCPDPADSASEATAVTVDLDGDGCPESVSVDGRTVQVASTQFELGAAGDLAGVTDDGCDGSGKLVLLRPSTGELFEFAELAGPDSPVEGRLRGVVPGAVALRPPDTTPGSRACGELHLVGVDGVDLGPAS